MTTLVKPHGSDELKPLLLEGAALEAEKKRAAGLPKINISSREAGDLVMLGIGGFTPLTGFMTRADWEGVCDGMKMANGLFWPIPITLSTDKVTADNIKEGQEIALSDRDTGEIMATMKVTEKYTIDKAHECMMVYKTAELDHPGVKMVMDQGEVNLAGPVKVLSTGSFKEEYGDQFMTPAETRAMFEKLGWSKIAAFQTRNPMHRSHEYLAKIAIETMDGVLIHSLLGALKPGDIPAEVRSEAISVLVDNYFAPNTVIQAGYPLDMRYAGPRDALGRQGSAGRVQPPGSGQGAAEVLRRPQRRAERQSGTERPLGEVKLFARPERPGNVFQEYGVSGFFNFKHYKLQFNINGEQPCQHSYVPTSATAARVRTRPLACTSARTT